MKSPKPYIVYALALVLFLCIMVLSYRMVGEISKEPDVSKESFRESLWDKWGITIVVIAFIIVAGGMGILVLLGGDWRWE
jgi:hypothetical protein